SQIFGVFVGPYAEWHLTEKEDTLTDELHSFLLAGENGAGLTVHHNPPTIMIQGGEYNPKILSPLYHAAAKEKPPRTFDWSEGEETGAADLQNIDPQAEIEWFQGAFKDQLNALSRHYGEPPTIRWGVVSSRG